MSLVQEVAATGHRVLHPPADARWWHRAPTFVVVGVAWTALYLALYAVLREPLGAQVANAVSLVLTTIGSTDSHRSMTFDVQNRSRILHLLHQSLGLILLLTSLGITSGSLWALHQVAPDAAGTTEMLALLVANGIAGSVRFGVFQLVMRRPAAQHA